MCYTVLRTVVLVNLLIAKTFNNNTVVSRYLQLTSLMLLFISFGRSIKGSSPHRDLDLNDNYYLMYGLGDTLTTSGYTIHM